MGPRVVFANRCSCRLVNCPHLAATAFAALDRFPALRRADQASFMDKLGAAPVTEKQRLLINLEPGMPPKACFINLSLVGQRTARLVSTTPARLIEENAEGDAAIALAHLLGATTTARTGVPAESVAPLVAILSPPGECPLGGHGQTPHRRRRTHLRCQLAAPGCRRARRSCSAIPGPGMSMGPAAPSGRVRTRQTRPEPVTIRPRIGRGRGASTLIATESERAIVERPVIPVMRLQRLRCPDDFGRLQMMDALMLDFDYGGTLSDGDDERQFVPVFGPGGQSFVRRNTEAEGAALETIRQESFVQMRVSDGKSARGRRVFVFRGEDAGERWHRFVTERVPALESLGFRSLIDKDFGPRMVQSVGEWDVRVSDAPTEAGPALGGSFSLDFGIEVDGVRIPLLPILSQLLARGGMETAQISGDELITTLEDGRIVKLPADRIGRMLAIMGDLIDATGAREDTLVLPEAEAATVIELETLLLTRWQDAGRIEAYTARFRGEANIPQTPLPPEFKGELRQYQQQGVDWLQHLMASQLGAFLADDMGLGKTAQTIAHITVEHASGRMMHPALIVVPTSLIANWTSELEKFAPGLKLAVLHGMDRHKKRDTLDCFDVVITTYTVLTRDILEMKERDWHIVVLDEAQAIKTPDAKATKAVCQLDARQRLCLSGTPIENNLEELWSQFAFLMPGLLGDRRGFTKRFRTPIEKNGDPVRRIQLARRIKPFIMRRKKSEVATELPPKPHDPAPHRPGPRSARALRDHPGDDVREGARAGGRAQPGPEPHHRARCIAETSAGMLRSAASQAAFGAGNRIVQQARRSSGNGQRDDPRRSAHPAVQPVHLHARSDKAAAARGEHPLRRAPRRHHRSCRTRGGRSRPARCRCS